MRILRRILALALFAGCFWLTWRFVNANPTEVGVDFVFWKLPVTPLWTLLLASFSAGAALGLLLVAWPLARGRLATRQYRKEVRRLESEVHQLRNLPLVAPDPLPVAPDASERRA